MSVSLLCLVFSAEAQDLAYNTYSPYTVFGIGDISKQGSAFNKGMGGVGIATRDKRNLNYLNPASLTARDEKSFMADFTLAQGNRYYAQGDLKSCNNTFNISSFAISFPVYKSLAMCAGFTPYSDLGYSISDHLSDPELIGRIGNVKSYADGEGGLSSIFLSGGFNVFKGMYAGVEVSHLFGKMQKSYSHEFDNTSFRSIFSGYLMNLKADSFKLGLQYDFNVSEGVQATVGATYKLSANLRGNVKDFEYTSISSVLDTTRNITTDLTKEKGLLKLAGETGIGVSLRGNDKWTAELNYISSDWSKSGMNETAGFANAGNMVFQAGKSQSFRAGFSLVPNRNDIRYFRKRITYKAGTYWDKAYYLVNGKPVNAAGITLGISLPVYRYYNSVSFGVDFGQRGVNDGGLLRERYVNFTIGINFHEFWFLKYHYD